MGSSYVQDRGGHVRCDHGLGGHDIGSSGPGGEETEADVSVLGMGRRSLSLQAGAVVGSVCHASCGTGDR